MNAFKTQLGALCLYLGITLGVFANVIGVGYGLYLWGAEGLILSTSVWLAFILWLKTIGLSVVFIVLSMFLLA